MNYKNYTAQIISEDANQITAELTGMIEREFPGITVREWTDPIGGSASTLGPDQSVCVAIDKWISENWTAAL